MTIKIGLTDPSPEALFSWAEERLGFSKKKARSILISRGLTRFKRDSWWTYILTLKQAFDDTISKAEYPEACPICKGEIERDRKRDGKFGARWGWKCKADRFHFMEYRWSLIRLKQEELIIVEDYGVQS